MEKDVADLVQSLTLYRKRAKRFRRQCVLLLCLSLFEAANAAFLAPDLFWRLLAVAITLTGYGVFRISEDQAKVCDQIADHIEVALDDYRRWSANRS